MLFGFGFSFCVPYNHGSSAKDFQGGSCHQRCAHLLLDVPSFCWTCPEQHQKHPRWGRKGRKREISAQELPFPPSLGQWITAQVFLWREELRRQTALFFPMFLLMLFCPQSAFPSFLLRTYAHSPGSKAKQALLSQDIGVGIYYKTSAVCLTELTHLFISKRCRCCASHWTELCNPRLALPPARSRMQLILQPFGRVYYQILVFPTLFSVLLLSLSHTYTQVLPVINA